MVVVFDIGNVLLRWNPRNLFRHVFADAAEMETFLATACSMDWIVETDRVEFMGPLLEARIAAFPQYARELRLFHERWFETLSGPIDENVEVFERLRAQGDKVYGVTNFCGETFELTRAKYPFLDGFAGLVVSGREGLVKPDPRIFELFLSRHSLAAEETLFIDDSERNIAAAKALGMATIHYSEGVDVAGELRARGVLR